MKNVLMLFAFIALLTGCSKDDDSPEVEIKFPSDHLVEQSPWTFNNIELLRINYNPNELTIAEAQILFKNTYTGFTMDFNENGTGSATLPDNTSYSFNWTLSIDYTTLTLTGNAPAVFTNISVTKDSFLFSDVDYCVADGLGDDVCADVRFTFK